MEGDPPPSALPPLPSEKVVLARHYFEKRQFFSSNNRRQRIKYEYLCKTTFNARAMEEKNEKVILRIGMYRTLQLTPTFHCRVNE
jgi:hypothetical protein